MEEPTKPQVEVKSGSGAIVQATLHIKRAATGLTETYQLKGYATKEQLEAAIRDGLITPQEDK